MARRVFSRESGGSVRPAFGQHLVRQPNCGREMARGGFLDQRLVLRSLSSSKICPASQVLVEPWCRTKVWFCEVCFQPSVGSPIKLWWINGSRVVFPDQMLVLHGRFLPTCDPPTKCWSRGPFLDQRWVLRGPLSTNIWFSSRSLARNWFGWVCLDQISVEPALFSQHLVSTNTWPAKHEPNFRSQTASELVVGRQGLVFLGQIPPPLQPHPPYDTASAKEGLVGKWYAPLVAHCLVAAMSPSIAGGLML